MERVLQKLNQSTWRWTPDLQRDVGVLENRTTGLVLEFHGADPHRVELADAAVDAMVEALRVADYDGLSGNCTIESTLTGGSISFKVVPSLPPSPFAAASVISAPEFASGGLVGGLFAGIDWGSFSF